MAAAQRIDIEEGFFIVPDIFSSMEIGNSSDITDEVPLKMSSSSSLVSESPIVLSSKASSANVDSPSTIVLNRDFLPISLNSGYASSDTETGKSPVEAIKSRIDNTTVVTTLGQCNNIEDERNVTESQNSVIFRTAKRQSSGRKVRADGELRGYLTENQVEFSLVSTLPASLVSPITDSRITRTSRGYDDSLLGHSGLRKRLSDFSEDNPFVDRDSPTRESIERKSPPSEQKALAAEQESLSIEPDSPYRRDSEDFTVTHEFESTEGFGSTEEVLEKLVTGGDTDGIRDSLTMDNILARESESGDRQYKLPIGISVASTEIDDSATSIQSCLSSYSYSGGSTGDLPRSSIGRSSICLDIMDRIVTVPALDIGSNFHDVGNVNLVELGNVNLGCKSTGRDANRSDYRSSIRSIPRCSSAHVSGCCLQNVHCLANFDYLGNSCVCSPCCSPREDDGEVVSDYYGVMAFNVDKEMMEDTENDATKEIEMLLTREDISDVVVIPVSEEVDTNIATSCMESPYLVTIDEFLAFRKDLEKGKKSDTDVDLDAVEEVLWTQLENDMKGSDTLDSDETETTMLQVERIFPLPEAVEMPDIPSGLLGGNMRICTDYVQHNVEGANVVGVPNNSSSSTTPTNETELIDHNAALNEESDDSGTILMNYKCWKTFVLCLLSSLSRLGKIFFWFEKMI